MAAAIQCNNKHRVIFWPHFRPPDFYFLADPKNSCAIRFLVADSLEEKNIFQRIFLTVYELYITRKFLGACELRVEAKCSGFCQCMAILLFTCGPLSIIPITFNSLYPIRERTQICNDLMKKTWIFVFFLVNFAFFDVRGEAVVYPI